MNGDNCSWQNESKQNPNLTMVAAAANKGFRSCKTSLGRTPNGLNSIHGPKTEKRWCNTKTDSGYHFVLRIPVDSKWIWAWDRCHWKNLEIIFPSIPSEPKSEPICDRGTHFSADCSWTPKQTRSQLQLGLQLGLDALAGLLRRWPRWRTSKYFLDMFSIFMGCAPTWIKVPIMNNKSRQWHSNFDGLALW